jgi:ATP-dependent DNA helicase RecG
MEISEFLENNEKENVEFKASLSEKNKILKTISAFSNKRGGAILVGINDNRDVVGVDIGRNTLENLANNIRREMDPQVYPYIDYSDINGKTVLIIEVSESVAKPVFYRNRAYIRVGRTNQRLSSTEIRNFISNESRITSWDEQVIEEVNFEEIDNKKVSNS